MAEDEGPPLIPDADGVLPAGTRLRHLLRAYLGARLVDVTETDADEVGDVGHLIYLHFGNGGTIAVDASQGVTFTDLDSVILDG